MSGRNLGLSAFLVAVFLGFWSPLASAQKFNLEEATIVDIHRAIKARQINATQLVNLYLKRIEAYNGTCVKGAVDPATGYLLGDIEPVEKAGKLGALITLNLRGKRSKTDPTDNDPAMPDALEVAKTLDAEFAKTGKLKGSLHGIPFAVKDQFDTFDMRSTSGAAANYANDRPPADAEIVARLRKAGAIILAKANMGEYASGDRSTFGGATCNPYDTSRSAGRSSGGSGAAVAANLVTCAIGEETGPSARNPAANNALVGVVATHSLISRAGLIPASLTRDRPGILCKSVKDAATVLSAVAGYDPKDAATAASVGQTPAKPYDDIVDGASLRGVRIGVVREFMQPHTKADEDSIAIAERAIADLKKGGPLSSIPAPAARCSRRRSPSYCPRSIRRRCRRSTRRSSPPGPQRSVDRWRWRAMRRACPPNSLYGFWPSGNRRRQEKGSLRWKDICANAATKTFVASAISSRSRRSTPTRRFPG